MSRYYPPVAYLLMFFLWLYVRVMARRGHAVSAEELAGLSELLAPLALLLYAALCLIVGGLVLLVVYAVVFHAVVHTWGLF